jgi:hypothetical protein
MSRRLQDLLICLALAAGSVPASAQGLNRPAPGGAQVVRPDADEDLQWAAAVVELDMLRNQGDATVKLFGYAGGDPAMNGLHTYLAFFEMGGDGWRAFRIGDFLDYRIVSERRGRVLLEISESIFIDDTGEIGTQRRRLLVSWTPGPDGAPPASVSVTAAR